MEHRTFLKLLLPLVLLHAFPLMTQQVGSAVPRLVNFSGKAVDAQGKALPGVSIITCTIYKDEEGGPALWTETQNVQADAEGKYTVQLGATQREGLALDLFSSGDSRWLGVRVNGGDERPRTLLLSVPYALKAVDAETLGGLPASAFALAGAALTESRTMAPSAAANGVTPDTTSTVTTGGGSSGYIPQFFGPSTIGDSIIYATGNSVGIGTIPNSGAKLDVGGSMIMRGPMTVSRTGNATSAKGFPSYGFDFFSNIWNSSTKTGDNAYFQLQSEPTGNNTSSPSATFNLLFSNNGAAAAETGLSINPNGTIHFSSAQTFPGTGDITGVTAGTALSGGGSSGNVTLNLDTTKVPLLAAGNIFTGANTFSGSATFFAPAEVNLTSAAPALLVANSGGGNGIYSTVDGVGGAGVYGLYGTPSVMGADYSGIAIWGDTHSTGHVAIAGSADDGNAGTFFNNSNDYPTLGADNAGPGGAAQFSNDSSTSPTIHVFNLGSGGTGLFRTLEASTSDGTCGFGGRGDLTCTGQVKTLTTTTDARQIETYSVQSPENWYEDAGSAQLVNGAAKVDLEPVFAQTVNTGVEYHVFLTPKGDSEGLYVSNETPQGFEVHEQRGGHSTIAFDYRIMARRVGYETVRLKDRTEEMKTLAAQREKLLHPVKRNFGQIGTGNAASTMLRKPSLQPPLQPTSGKSD